MLNAQVIMNPLLELSVGMDLGSGAGGRRKIVCVHNCDVRFQFTWSPGRVRRICDYLFWESPIVYDETPIVSSNLRVRRKVFFDGLDQGGDTDRFCQKRATLDSQAGLLFPLRGERR